jgi:ParB family chromosome partitioning protein
MKKPPPSGLPRLEEETPANTLQTAPVGSIVPNRRQPRSIFDQQRLQELADSMREYGILQPLVVRPLAEGKFELIAGERRLRAAKLAGLEDVPILVRHEGHQASLELALIENIQREEIGPMECARAYRKLMDEFGLTQEQVAGKVGKARTSVANTIRLLRLPMVVQEALESGQIQEGHARALLAFETEAEQLKAFQEILDGGLSVRAVEKSAREVKPAGRPAPSIPSQPVWPELEEALSTHFGSRVQMAKAETGGKITLEFYSDEDLERILAVLGIGI